jgi:protein-S-isoprenylcysteine O-methyltransferase Ste14
MWRHVRAIVLLPGVVTLVVPVLLVWRSGAAVTWPLAALGLALIAVGLALVARTVSLFASAGDGTLAPWDETTRLVVSGPYRHVRNPMISGVVAILLGESALLGSRQLLVWAACVFAVNAVYMPLVEEPRLRRRFGEDYDRYREHVPRWVPRLRPWSQPPVASRSADSRSTGCASGDEPSS